MTKYIDLLDQLKEPETGKLFVQMYGNRPGVVETQTNRYIRLIHEHGARFQSQDKDMFIFSAPGRTEIGGNHTDHNGGRVLAAGVSLDTIAAVVKNDNYIITVHSEGYPEPFIIDVRDTDLREEEKGTTFALIRGITARMKELGYRVGGFDACVTSSVLKGSGLSSSASFEVLMCTIFDHLYNDGKMDGKKNAMISQYAENVYFGKPSGLMDQTTCALGGFVTIDFADFQNPVVQSVEFDFAASGYNLVVVDTGGDHADLTDEYAAIAREMKQVAAVFERNVLREVSPEKVTDHIADLKGKVSDRAILRALHFYDDDARVVKEVEALNHGDFKRFLSLVVESGESSWKHLQNCYVGGHDEQGLTLALAQSERILKGKGAWRVHGGGFAGTIQAFVPKELLDEYVKTLNGIFGDKACTILSIRPFGSIHVKLG